MNKSNKSCLKSVCDYASKYRNICHGDKSENALHVKRLILLNSLEFFRPSNTVFLLEVQLFASEGP